ncbi:hypothetical protein DYQ86_03755 [Acidobacteria bacterium AB60]|nr:hypothetical protein DYQ86_03755 [Acidobacteria bacterium AB60]
MVEARTKILVQRLLDTPNCVTGCPSFSCLDERLRLPSLDPFSEVSLPYLTQGSLRFLHVR